jgi:hypothetical protein
MAMQREKLESAAAEYHYLRGLFGIPLGCLLFLSALGNWRWGPLRHDWVFLLGVLAIAAASVAINNFYGEHYGRVTLSTRQQVRAAVTVAVGAPMFFLGSLLLRSRASWSLDLPVIPIAILFALLMLATYAATVGLRTHHVIVFGALLAVGATPVWNGADPSNIGLVLAGVATVVVGIFDHRLLVRTLGRSDRLNLADDVGA